SDGRVEPFPELGSVAVELRGADHVAHFGVDAFQKLVDIRIPWAVRLRVIDGDEAQVSQREQHGVVELFRRVVGRREIRRRGEADADFSVVQFAKAVTYSLPFDEAVFRQADLLDGNVSLKQLVTTGLSRGIEAIRRDHVYLADAVSLRLQVPVERFRRDD